VSEESAIRKTQSYRASSEALHRDGRAQERHGANLRMLWECGLADLIRRDFYGLFAFPENARGAFLDAGCGTGIEVRNLRSRFPDLELYGVDISAVALARAVADNARKEHRFYQAALEALPLGDGVFDYIGSHEVIEHVDDPAPVLKELHRVLKAGGVCVIATPNGASLWVEHLRQRIARLFGRRGAPVGEDHVRPPSFWRREFMRAGFAIERRIFDGAALEFLTYVAPARMMPLGASLLEPLRIVPIVNLLVCDRVKYRLRKPGPGSTVGEPRVVCALCRSALSLAGDAAECLNGHRFGRSTAGVIDFTTPLSDGASGKPASAAPPAGSRQRRHLRRLLLAAGCALYVAFLTALLPLGFAAGRRVQPMRPSS
jgi:SAM-dependent methyltransferase